MAQTDRRETPQDNLGMDFRVQEKNESAEGRPASEEVCVIMR